MSTLFTFPGQGAQYAGMLHQLPDHPAAQAVLAHATQVLGHDARELDSAEALHSTVAVQLCLLIAGVAGARRLAEEAGPPDVVAGLSIGAFAAAVVAGVLDEADAVRLVHLRGSLMQAAYPSGYGMTAILGLERSALEPLIAQVHGPSSPVYLANLNAPTQLVVAGALPALDQVATLALAHGASAARPVAISVPSHCPLLNTAADTLSEALDRITLHAPTARYLSASAARELWTADAIRADLARNMALPVRWHDTMLLAVAKGVGLTVEMPPGSVLTRLARAGQPCIEAVAAADTRLDSIAVLMQRERDNPRD